MQPSNTQRFNYSTICQQAFTGFTVNSIHAQHCSSIRARCTAGAVRSPCILSRMIFTYHGLQLPTENHNLMAVQMCLYIHPSFAWSVNEKVKGVLCSFFLFFFCFVAYLILQAIFFFNQYFYCPFIKTVFSDKVKIFTQKAHSTLIVYIFFILFYNCSTILRSFQLLTVIIQCIICVLPSSGQPFKHSQTILKII